MFTYEKTNISFSSNGNIIKANSKYIVSIEDENIEIFIFENKKLIKICEKVCNSSIEKLEMSKIYYNIFLTVSYNIIDIFEILNSSKNYQIQNKLRIETNEFIKFAKFSEYNGKIIGAISDSKIRLWNIDSTFNYITIKPEFKYVRNFIFNKNNNLLMIQTHNENNSYEILIYDISYHINVKKVIKRKQKDYIYEISEKNFEKIIFVNKSSIEFMDLINDVIYDKIELNFEKDFKYICFYKNIQILIIFSKSIPYIIDIKNKKKEISDRNESRIFDDFSKAEKNKFYINILRESYIQSFGFDFKDDKTIMSLEKEVKIYFQKNLKKFIQNQIWIFPLLRLKVKK